MVVVEVTEETQREQGAGEQERVQQEERERKRGRGMERDVEISRDEAGQAWVSGVSSKKPRAREVSPCGQGMGVCEGVRLQERGAGGLRDTKETTRLGDTQETTRLHPTGNTVVRMPSIFEMCT